MITYRSRWTDRDLNRLEETNKLYEIVKLYGGYLYYINNENQGEFKAYYYHNEWKMRYIFLNTANADAKKHFNKLCISGTKMRKLLQTSRKIIKSYGWMPQYVEYVLEKCFNNDELKDKMIEYLQEDCEYCENEREFDVWKALCAKRLLGFQYDLLSEISQRRTKKSFRAMNDLKRVEDSAVLKNVIMTCPIANEI